MQILAMMSGSADHHVNLDKWGKIIFVYKKIVVRILGGSKRGSINIKNRVN